MTRVTLHASTAVALACAACGMTVSSTVSARVIALDIDITLDQVSPEEKGMKVGMHHNCRIFYDDTQVDPATRKVRALHQQHTPMLIPKHLDPLQEPMFNAWLDLSTQPYRYHYAASPGGGNWPFPYSILFDDTMMRMTIRKQSDGSLLLSGKYVVDPTPITGPEIDAVVASTVPEVMPWVKGPAPKFPGEK